MTLALTHARQLANHHTDLTTPLGCNTYAFRGGAAWLADQDAGF